MEQRDEDTIARKEHLKSCASFHQKKQDPIQTHQKSKVGKLMQSMRKEPKQESNNWCQNSTSFQFSYENE